MRKVVGIILLSVDLLFSGLAILSAYVEWTTVPIIILAICGLAAIIDAVVNFFKGNIADAVLVLVIGVAVPLLGAWGLSALCWNYLVWVAVLMPTAVIVANISAIVAND